MLLGVIVSTAILRDPCSGLRPDNLYSKPSGAVLDAPEEIYAPAPTAARRRSKQANANSRRDFGEDFASSLPAADDGFDSRRQSGGFRLRFNGKLFQVPKTWVGRIFGGVGCLAVAGCAVAGFIAVRSFFLHDERFTIASSSSIQIVGNAHLSRPQLLSVFGEDVERNIFNVPLTARRTELESLPWVEHATVMRLLPNHLRISVTERTPVAFVRQGSQIGMVDATGVLLDMPPDAPGDPHYSFPVITGVTAADPISTRAARMKMFTEFSADLDSTGDHISQKLSEVDLSNPEDVKALIPEGSSDILVHFGDSDFLARYQKFEAHLAEWRTQYPKLGSVDMRYERQVVLEMQGGAAAAAPAATAVTAAPAAKPALKSTLKPVTKPVLQAAAKIPPAKAALPKPVSRPKPEAISVPAPAASNDWHMVVVKPHTKAVPLTKAKPVHPHPASPQ